MIKLLSSNPFKTWLINNKTIIVCFLLLFVSIFAHAEQIPNEFTPNSIHNAVVVKHSDGDTIKVKVDGLNKTFTVRLLNADTPETKFQRLSQGLPGELAAQRLKELLPLQSKVQIELDVKPTDIYGRLLGYVIKDGVEINLQMVREGMALPLFFAPNLSKAEIYKNAGELAQVQRVGVFGSGDVQVPTEFRVENSGRDEAKYVASIKGGAVVPFSQREQIPLLERVFFVDEQHITGRFRLSVLLCRHLFAK